MGLLRFLSGGGCQSWSAPASPAIWPSAEDAHDLSNGILQLLEDETLRQALSQRCRAIALKDYPLELRVQRYLELYRHVLAYPCRCAWLCRFRQAVQEHIDGRRGLTSRACP